MNWIDTKEEATVMWTIMFGKFKTYIWIKNNKKRGKKR